MRTRRSILGVGLASILGAGFLPDPFVSAMRWASAASRKVLDRGTRRESLIREDPAALDTTNLEVTPLDDFGTMGPTDLVVDSTTWRLEVTGQVRRPLRLTYAQITALPSIEREVLLICPGFFANHGRWKGVSISGLLDQAEFDRTAAHIVIEAKGGKTSRFPLADTLSGKIFLAYQVNGKTLPRKHGFPLRAVAADSYGSDWVKYVEKITVERT